MENLHEGLAELDVEGRVDDGVHGAVDIAQPREGAVQDRWDVAITVNVQDVCDEEGQPADDEHAWRRGWQSGWPWAREKLNWEGTQTVSCRPWPKPWNIALSQTDICPTHSAKLSATS